MSVHLNYIKGKDYLTYQPMQIVLDLFVKVQIVFKAVLFFNFAI